MHAGLLLFDRHQLPELEKIPCSHQAVNIYSFSGPENARTLYGKCQQCDAEVVKLPEGKWQ